MPSSLEVRTETRGNAVVIHVVGDAGMANVDGFQESLTHVCAKKPKLVVFDMSGMTFISSIGMGTLVTFMKGVERCGGTVILAALQPMISDAFKRARLTDILKLRNTVEECLSSEPAPSRTAR